jgi:hypothetical protein
MDLSNSQEAYMEDSQKKGRGSSGGQRIDDHSFWAGGKSAGSPFPEGPHKLKAESSAEGAGSLDHYEDTTETIKSQQEMGISQAKARPLKTGYRN